MTQECVRCEQEIEEEELDDEGVCDNCRFSDEQTELLKDYYNNRL